MSIQEQRAKDLNKAAAEGGAPAVIRMLMDWESPWSTPDTRELQGIASFCQRMRLIADEVQTYNQEAGKK